ncbi:hypothetical protein MRB53_011962 [Persea americana]|uniref:Uncharacterized protein n=1 Tax=Persea americana TaxID=3435 RepID=A0ACC2LWA4_PERAE|nr:hypothetical protein MRB53_011962 [Persea americana]
MKTPSFSLKEYALQVLDEIPHRSKRDQKGSDLQKLKREQTNQPAAAFADSFESWSSLRKRGLSNVERKSRRLARAGFHEIAVKGVFWFSWEVWKWFLRKFQSGAIKKSKEL